MKLEKEKYIQDLLDVLGFNLVQGKLMTYRKNYKNGFYIIVNLNKRLIIYPPEINIGRETINNFSNNENFVVLECVDRLLTIGYKPKNICLEKSYRGGWIDILINNDNDTKADNQYAIIECKTYGKEYEKAYDKLITESKSSQLFDYAQQYKSVKKISLYSSVLINSEIEIQHIIIPITEKMKATTNAKAMRMAWSGIGYEHGLFDVDPYALNSTPLKYDDLKEVKSGTGKKLYNDFATILRKYVISDKSNAYNKLFNLFLCKIVDEEQSNKPSKKQTPLNFQYHEKDSLEEFIKRLNALYKIGVKEYLGIEITDYTDSEIEEIVGDNLELRKILDELRLYRNNEFSFIEVYNEDTFYNNAVIVKEVVKLLQNYRLKYTQKQPYLGLFFENLLNSGFKQESGQFFTPIPIAKFIVSSIPMKNIIQDKIEAGKANFLPYIIDYACGSGHFLTEAMDEIQSLLPSFKENGNLTKSQLKSIEAFLSSEFSWANEYIYGIDFDNRLAKTTKVNTFLNGDGEANIVCANGLDPFTSDNYIKLLRSSNPSKNEVFDVLLANPPYSVKNFKPTILDGESRFTLFQNLGKNSDDIECLFVERMGQILADDAFVGIILPSSILESGRTHTHARKYILDNFRIVALVKLSNLAFMKTGTNTVALFLQKKTTKENDKLRERITVFFQDNTFSDFSWGKTTKAMTSYIKDVYDMSLDAYIKDIFKSPDFNLKAEKEMIYTYIITKEQNVIVVDVGEKDKAKSFLGYDYSERRGSEGIQERYIDESDYEIDTKLFSEKTLSEEKVNYYIYHNFLENKLFTIADSLKNNVFSCSLSNLIPYELNKKKDFDAYIIMNKPELDKCLLINSKYPIKHLREILPGSVRKGTSITKKDAIEGVFPVIGGGKTHSYTHNINNREAGVITISASGASAGYIWYHSEPIFASDCNTIESEDKVLLKFIYYILQYKQDDIHKVARGNAQPHVYEPQIYKFLIPMPEDRKIIEDLVNKCEDIDSDKRSKEEVLLKKKREIIENILGIV